MHDAFIKRLIQLRCVVSVDLLPGIASQPLNTTRPYKDTAGRGNLCALDDNALDYETVSYSLQDPGSGPIDHHGEVDPMRLDSSREELVGSFRIDHD